MSDSGLLCISTVGWTVGLIVIAGRVVDGPPLARSRKLVGADARELWRQYHRQGARLAWLPGEVVSR